MIQKRLLSDEEKIICENQVEKLSFEIKDLEYQEKYNQLMSETGLQINYLKKQKELSQMIKAIQEQLKLNRQKIDELKSQLKYGVVIKKQESEE